MYTFIFIVNCCFMQPDGSPVELEHVTFISTIEVELCLMVVY
jgi:hypothetical protein